MKKRLICVIAAVLLLFSSACAVNKYSAEDTAATSAAPPMPAAAYDAVMDEGGYEYDYYGEASAEPTSAAGSSGAAGLTQEIVDAYGGHKIIKNYDLSFETDDFDGDYAFVVNRAAAFGGYVSDSYVNGKKPEAYNEAGRNANLTIRVPSDKAIEFVTEVKGAGEITYYNENARDVTSEYFDRETRLDVLKIQLDRLKSILVQTDNLADIIALETEIARVTTEIEELTSELRRYDDLIDYSTVTVSIYELSLSAGPSPKKTVGERIDEGFTETLYGIGTFFTDLAVFLVTASPVILILAVIAVVVIVIVKAAGRRKKEKLGGYYETSKSDKEKTEK